MYHSTAISGHSSPYQGHHPSAESNQPEAIRLTKREKEFLQWSEAGKSSWQRSQRQLSLQ
jgi:LuxR family quorum-sensing transcriptional regulator LasR